MKLADSKLGAHGSSVGPGTSGGAELPGPKLFRAYGPYMFRYVRRMGIAGRSREDVVRRVFMFAHRHREDYRGEVDPQVWLTRIARAITVARRGVAYDELSGLTQLKVKRPSDQKSKLRDVLDCALDQLTDLEREVFILHDMEHLGAHAVATTMALEYERTVAIVARARKLVHATIDEFATQRGTPQVINPTAVIGSASTDEPDYEALYSVGVAIADALTEAAE